MKPLNFIFAVKPGLFGVVNISSQCTLLGEMPTAAFPWTPGDLPGLENLAA